MNGGAGNDDIRFATANFTDKDTVSGGDGVDEITITDAATVVDAATNVTGVETLALEAAGTDVDLGVLADAAGVRTVVLLLARTTMTLTWSRILLATSQFKLDRVTIQLLPQQHMREQ